MNRDYDTDTLHSNFQDVKAFHKKFDVPESPVPAWLDVAGTSFRAKFMQEELDEFGDAYREGDLPKAADALVDLVYVALGTAAMMGLDWQQLWDKVHPANMAKERSTSADDPRSTRRTALNIVKPEGWTPPDHTEACGGPGPWPTYMTGERRLSWPTQAERAANDPRARIEEGGDGDDPAAA